MTCLGVKGPLGLHHTLNGTQCSNAAAVEASVTVPLDKNTVALVAVLDTG